MTQCKAPWQFCTDDMRIHTVWHGEARNQDEAFDRARAALGACRIHLMDTDSNNPARSLETRDYRSQMAEADEWPARDRRVIRRAKMRGLAIVDDPAHDSALIDEVRERMREAEYRDHRPFDKLMFVL